MVTKILALAGSCRKNSFNVQLLQNAAKGAIESGAEVTLLDLNQFPLPIFNEDLEAEGTPENAVRLKEIFIDHHGLLIASPEYNSSISPLLKNTIDWVSRPKEGEPRLVAYQDKVASIMSASPGGLGGIRGLVHLRSILSNIGVTVLPNQYALSSAHEAFDALGNLTDEKTSLRVQNQGKELALTLSKLLA